MTLKKYKPVTASQRGLVLVSKASLHKGKPLKSKVKRIPSTGGRNNQGHITVRHQGGRKFRKLYRIIDFKRYNHLDMPAVVQRIEYDPNRTAFIAMIEYNTGEKDYILAPNKLSVGDVVMASLNAEIKPGNSLPLMNIPVGTLVHNIEMKPGKGGQLTRAAGSYAQVVGKESGYVQVVLMSGEQRLININCWATIGSVANNDHINQCFAKAGRQRWKGIRPTVRGVAMNPIDHPHGGGEGRTSGGRHPVTPWGISTKGKVTRSNKKTSKYIVVHAKKR